MCHMSKIFLYIQLTQQQANRACRKRTIPSPAEIERRRYFQKKKQQQAIRHAANDERTSAFGYFTFCRYISSAPFWANMPNADLVRLFYLSTYMLYERSTLCYSNGRMLTADSLPEVLQTSESTCRRFLAAMEQQGYLQIEDGAVTMNTEYFARQSIRYWIGDERSFIRVYHNAYHCLYRQLENRQRGQLAYLIRMIPYLHEERNIVYVNRFAHDASRIVPLDDKRICEAVGYNPNQSARLMRDLQALHLETGQSPSSTTLNSTASSFILRCSMRVTHKKQSCAT